MCTAICKRCESGVFFGRNLDLEYSFDEKIVLTPRAFALKYKYEEESTAHNAILGAATLYRGAPLYYDAVNEHGLCMAALNFPASAVLHEKREGMINLPNHEIIPYILSRCKNINEAAELLENINLTQDSPCENMPAARLHFMLSDKKESITAEPAGKKIKIYKNTAEVLTNEPPFDFHMNNLSLYLNLFNTDTEDGVLKKTNTKRYCRGLGAHGLPGDLTSPSRFIRAAYLLAASTDESEESKSVLQAFRILGRTSFIEGEVKIGDKYDITRYTSVIDAEGLTYYFTSFKSPAVYAVTMKEKDMQSSELITYPLYRELDIRYINHSF